MRLELEWLGVQLKGLSRGGQDTLTREAKKKGEHRMSKKFRRK